MTVLNLSNARVTQAGMANNDAAARYIRRHLGLAAQFPSDSFASCFSVKPFLVKCDFSIFALVLIQPHQPPSPSYPILPASPYGFLPSFP